MKSSNVSEIHSVDKRKKSLSQLVPYHFNLILTTGQYFYSTSPLCEVKMASIPRSILSTGFRFAIKGLSSSTKATNLFRQSALRSISTSVVRPKEEVTVTFVKASGEKHVAKGKVGVNLVIFKFL